MDFPRRRSSKAAAAPVHGKLYVRVLIFTAAALLAICVLALSRPPYAAAAQTGAGAPDCAPGVDFLGFSDSLNKTTFEDTNVGGLSALTYDRQEGVYYSLVDNERDTRARFYTLDIPLGRSGLGDPSVLDVTSLRNASGQSFTGTNFDGEGLALTRRGDLLASSETEPSIRRFAPDGDLQKELPVPRKFRVAPAGEGRANQTFESLSLSPNARSLFTANEGSLVADGETADGSDRIRILRYEDRGRGGFKPAEEFFYLAEPGQGVVEIATLSENELLVLERGFIAGEGNTVRIFQVSLKGAEDVSDEPTLSEPGLVSVKKELLVDLADCPPSGATSPGTQQNPLLDNFEALALGPRLPGGRRALILVSDDNFSPGQVTRVVALGARLR